MKSEHIKPGSQRAFTIRFAKGGGSENVAKYLLAGYGTEGASKTVVVPVCNGIIRITHHALESSRELKIVISDDPVDGAEFSVVNGSVTDGSRLSLKPTNGVFTISTSVTSSEVLESFGRNLIANLIIHGGNWKNRKGEMFVDTWGPPKGNYADAIEFPIGFSHHGPEMNGEATIFTVMCPPHGQLSRVPNTCAREPIYRPRILAAAKSLSGILGKMQSGSKSVKMIYPDGMELLDDPLGMKVFRPSFWEHPDARDVMKLCVEGTLGEAGALKSELGDPSVPVEFIPLSLVHDQGGFESTHEELSEEDPAAVALTEGLLKAGWGDLFGLDKTRQYSRVNVASYMTLVKFMKTNHGVLLNLERQSFLFDQINRLGRVDVPVFRHDRAHQPFR